MMVREKFKYGFLWVTLGLFAVSLAGHWALAWVAYADEARRHGGTPTVGGYVVEASRDTLENWQSEFLQLVWQVAGLAFLLHVGSPQSKEGTERMEAKMDFIMSSIAGGSERRAELDRAFRRQG